MAADDTTPRVRVHDAATGEELDAEVIDRGAPTCAPCPPPLPSSTATRAMLRGEPGGIARVGWAMAGRAVLVAAGLALARGKRRLRKPRQRRQLVIDALAGALSIQAGVIGVEAANLRAERRRGGGR